MKKHLVTILPLMIIGCAATKLDSNADNIVVSPSHQVPQGCQYLGQVVGNQGNMFTGSWTSNENMAIGAMNDLRNKAAGLGANYIQLLTNQASGTGGGGFNDSTYQQTNVTNIGNAYKCPESAIVNIPK